MKYERKEKRGKKGWIKGSLKVKRGTEGWMKERTKGWMERRMTG